MRTWEEFDQTDTIFCGLIKNALHLHTDLLAKNCYFPWKEMHFINEIACFLSSYNEIALLLVALKQILIIKKIYLDFKELFSIKCNESTLKLSK